MKQGFVALISVLVVGAIILIIGLSVIISSVQEVDMAEVDYRGKQALALAGSCAELGIMRLKEFGSEYEGRELFRVGNLTCNVLAVEDQSFIARGSFGGAVKRVRVEIDDIWDGLVGWWRFDDGQGCVASDSSLNQNEGTLSPNDTGCDVWVSRRDEEPTKLWPTALSFSAGEHVLISQSLNLDSDFSVALWIKPDFENKENWTAEVNEFYFISATSSWSGWVTKDGDVGTNIISNGIDFTNTHSGLNSISNIWHHIVFMKEGETHKLFVDGDLKSSTTGGEEETLGSVANPSNIYLGYEHYFGLIDDVRLYDRALSAIEIGNIINADYSWQMVD